MKLFKKIITLLFLAAILFTTFPSYASTETFDEYGFLNYDCGDPQSNPYILLNQGEEADILKNKENLLSKKASLKKMSMQSRIRTDSLNLGVNCFRQETTSSSGTYVYKMAQELNARQSRFTYYYDHITTSTIEGPEFVSMCQDLIYAREPFILHANTKYLFIYNGASLGHYLTVEGYHQESWSSGTWTGVAFEYVDPYYENYGEGSVLGKHSMSSSEAYNCVYNRYVIW